MALLVPGPPVPTGCGSQPDGASPGKPVDASWHLWGPRPANLTGGFFRSQDRLHGLDQLRAGLLPAVIRLLHHRVRKQERQAEPLTSGEARRPRGDAMARSMTGIPAVDQIRLLLSTKSLTLCGDELWQSAALILPPT